MLLKEDLLVIGLVVSPNGDNFYYRGVIFTVFHDVINFSIVAEK